MLGKLPRNFKTVPHQSLPPAPTKTAGPDVGVATWLEGFQELGAESNHFYSMRLDGLLLPLILMRLDKEIKNLACI